MLHPSRPTNEQNKTFSSPIVRCRSFVQVGAAKSTVVAFLRRCPAPQQKILRCDMDRRRLCRRPTHRPTEGHGLSPSMSGDSFSLPFSPIKCLNQRGTVPLLNKKIPRCDMDRRRLRRRPAIRRRPAHPPTEGHGLSSSMSGDSFSLPFFPIKCLNQRLNSSDD
jgi:hypothetical protein